MNASLTCGRRLAAIGIFAVACSLGVLTTPAAAAPGQLWSGAAEVASPGGMTTGEDGATLTDISCPGPRTCGAIGQASRGGHDQAIVADGLTGNGGQAEFVQLPDPTQVTGSVLESIDCPAAGECTAVGYETVASIDDEAIVISEVDGVWGTAAVIEVPVASEEATLTSVSCTAPGSCTAVGFYEDAADEENWEAFAVTAVDGIWGAVTTVPQPGNAWPDGGLQSVSCPAVGSCAATGWYYDRGTESYEALGATETDGTWSSEEIKTPDNDGGYEYTVLEVSCAAVGSCRASGYYHDASIEDYRAITASLADGSWPDEATIIESPGGAANDGEYAYLEAPSCPTTDFCAAGGAYDEVAEGQILPMVVEAHGRRWGEAQALSLPSGALTEQGAEALHVSREAVVEALTCWAAGECAAVGYYTNTLGLTAPLVAVEAGGTWEAADGVFVPPIVDGNSRLTTVSCAAGGGCGAAGSFVNAAGEGRGLAATAVTPLQVTSSGLPVGGVGLPYEARLAAAGGGGDYTWGIESGSLPAGLSLDPETGAIAGTPTAVGDSNVTIRLSDPGPPSQLTQASFSIRVVEVDPLQITTAGLPGATVGDPYEARLAAQGGSGGYTWSVAGGSLPDGLALDPGTGVISGTPTEAGDARFTVAVEAPGPPSQSARRELSVAVAGREESGSDSHTGSTSPSAPGAGQAPAGPPAAPAGRPTPSIAVRSSKLKVVKGAVKVKLACRGTACRGAAKLTVVLPRAKASADRGAPGKRTLVLARKRYRIGAGMVKVVGLRLTSSGRRLALARLGRQRAKLTVSVRGGRTVSKKVFLKVS